MYFGILLTCFEKVLNHSTKLPYIDYVVYFGKNFTVFFVKDTLREAKGENHNMLELFYETLL